MSEDCQKCGTAIWDLDEDGNCPACSDIEDRYNWEEQEYAENREFYENDLETGEEITSYDPND